MVTCNKNSENRMCRLAKQKSNKANLSRTTKGYFRETYKSHKNVNTISPTPKFILGIILIKIKSLITSCQSLVKKNKLICTFSISDVNLTQRSGCA